MSNFSKVWETQANSNVMLAYRPVRKGDTFLVQDDDLSFVEGI